jgi:integrase
MVRMQHRLSARTVETKTTPGYFADGAGLYLQITKTVRNAKASVTRSWIFRYRAGARAREMGLGSLRDVGLAAARLKAAACRRLVLDGKDPIAERDAARTTSCTAIAAAPSFDDCARAYIAAHRDGWRNAKHAQQWETTLRLHASPMIGALPVSEVALPHVMRVLEPIWRERTETASRLRGRIESILAWATVRGFRSGDNPARWRGHLDHLLPAPSKVATITHHAALSHADLREFVHRLRQQRGAGARALEFLILTAARSGEVRGACWDEIDLAARVWTVPAARMKAGREHRVPLSGAAVELIKQMQPCANTGLVFPAPRGGPLSDMTLSAVMRRMKVNAVPHGFRSTFRDWCAEHTDFPREVAEMALAHAIGDKVEAAYRRGDLFDKRRALMALWAQFCGYV